MRVLPKVGMPVLYIKKNTKFLDRGKIERLSKDRLFIRWDEDSKLKPGKLISYNLSAWEHNPFANPKEKDTFSGYITLDTEENTNQIVDALKEYRIETVSIPTPSSIVITAVAEATAKIAAIEAENKTKEKEKEMSNLETCDMTKPYAAETTEIYEEKTLVHGADLKVMSETSLVNMLRNLEEDKRQMRRIKVKSKYIEKQLEKNDKAIAAVVAELDNRVTD